MIQLLRCENTTYLVVYNEPFNNEQQNLQTMNTPEKSTKSENYNEYTINRFEDAILLTLAKWNARKYGTFAFDTFL